MVETVFYRLCPNHNPARGRLSAPGPSYQSSRSCCRSESTRCHERMGPLSLQANRSLREEVGRNDHGPDLGKGGGEPIRVDPGGGASGQTFPPFRMTSSSPICPPV